MPASNCHVKWASPIGGGAVSTILEIKGALDHWAAGPQAGVRPAVGSWILFHRGNMMDSNSIQFQITNLARYTSNTVTHSRQKNDFNI